jgi:A/G-specific adenine glycosylase
MPRETPASADQRTQAHEHLLAWYAAHGRDLPWRHTRDPYAVLVSEVMLQQTQVERVLPKYREFLERFPTLAALAEAPTADVIRAWAPLGYNVRAVRLQQIARQVVAEHGGELPHTLDGLLALKGIGRYTAGAVACFAFGLPVATVDTNIRRVLWRVFRGIEPAEWPAGQAGARELLALADWALPGGAAYDWQQALMDLGATICVSRRPACERCPLAADCSALAEADAVALFRSGEALAALRDARHAGQTPDPAPSHETASSQGSARMVAEPRGAYAAAGSPEAQPGASRGRRRGNGASQPFTSTSRYFRGRVLAALREMAPGETLALGALGPQVKPDWQPSDMSWLRGIVTGLARDGLVRLVPGPETGEAEETRVALP